MGYTKIIQRFKGNQFNPFTTEACFYVLNAIGLTLLPTPATSIIIGFSSRFQSNWDVY